MALSLVLSCSGGRETWPQSGALDCAALRSVDSGIYRDQIKIGHLFPNFKRHSDKQDPAVPLCANTSFTQPRVDFDYLLIEMSMPLNKYDQKNNEK